METMSEGKPTLEYYADKRVGWAERVPGAEQRMKPSQSESKE